MPAAEYDVLVNLKVGRDSQRAMAASGASFRRVMQQAEREQQRLHRSQIARVKQHERESLRAMAAVDRARKKSEREQIAATKARAREEARAAAAAKAKNLAMGRALLGTTSAAGGFFSGIGTGGAVVWARSAASVITTILSGAVAVGLGSALVGGFGDNMRREQLTGGIGTTLNLYDFNAVDKAGAKRSDEDQFAENIENAKWYQAELQRVADAAPGDINQVTTLFQGMLPGMASITQDAERIVNLTQKASLLSAVLENDFKTVGAQSSRILTGGAGAEFETWNRLQKPIRQAGIELGYFNKNQKMGTALTEKFNKLAPEQRLELFERGLSRLGKPVSDYYENTFDGIVSQAKSSMLTIRREFGKGPFEAIKDRIKEMNKGGVLARGSQSYQNLQAFAGYLGRSVGAGVVKAIDIAERATGYIANNWQMIVQRAQEAGHYMVAGAKVAVGLMGVRTGIGLAAGGVGAVLGAASTAASLVSLGAAAAFLVPILAGLAIVTGGVGVLLGGAVAYVVSNLDTLSAQFWTWAERSSAVIDPFFVAIDDLGAKFVALGGYLLGAGTETDIFTGMTTTATSVVESVTSAFEWLLRTTADMIDAFGSFSNLLDNMTGKTAVDSVEGLMLHRQLDEIRAQYGSTLSGEGGKAAESIHARLEELSGGRFGDRAKEAAASIRAGADVWRDAKAAPRDSSLSNYLVEKMWPMGPAKAPTSVSSKTPPKVNVKQTNYITMNVRDTDPNAIVAAFNKNSGRRAAMPIRSVLAARRP